MVSFLSNWNESTDFSGRDGVIKHNLDEIEEERRVGYAWQALGLNNY